MREFFHGWRRKTGVVALVMACLLMGMWVRSLSVHDSFWWMQGRKRHVLDLGAGRIYWQSWIVHKSGEWCWLCKSFESNQDERQFVDTTESRAARKRKGPRNTSRSMSFSTLVIPLTLLSAYLVLWKPRPKPKTVAR
jgi:hypothetical protein